MRTKEELKALQCLPLERKVLVSQARIFEWYQKHGGMVYVSFSGGKDSTVLLHIVRQIYPDVPAVFCDTGLEFPGVKAHVKAQENVTIIRPDMTFRDVIEKYGWCFPGKEVAGAVEAAKNGKSWGINKMNGRNAKGEYSDFKFGMYNRWQWLVGSPLKISNKCCKIMKKDPFHKYEQDAKRAKIVGTMAEESRARMTSWLEYGCNSFGGSGRSAPLSFWTGQDILRYITINDINIPVEYGQIVDDDGKLRTTGEARTGCIFCPVACHLTRGEKFRRLRRMYPKLYNYCMETLGLADFLHYVGEKLKIDFFTEQESLFLEAGK